MTPLGRKKSGGILSVCKDFLCFERMHESWGGATYCYSDMRAQTQIACGIFFASRLCQKRWRNRGAKDGDFDCCCCCCWFCYDFEALVHRLHNWTIVSCTFLSGHRLKAWRRNRDSCAFAPFNNKSASKAYQNSSVISLIQRLPCRTLKSFYLGVALSKHTR